MGQGAVTRSDACRFQARVFNGQGQTLWALPPSITAISDIRDVDAQPASSWTGADPELTRMVLQYEQQIYLVRSRHDLGVLVGAAYLGLGWLIKY